MLRNFVLNNVLRIVCKFSSGSWKMPLIQFDSFSTRGQACLLLDCEELTELN